MNLIVSLRGPFTPSARRQILYRDQRNNFGGKLSSILCLIFKFDSHYGFAGYYFSMHPHTTCLMVLMLDGNSEIDAHVKSKIGYLICSRHLFRVPPSRSISLFLSIYLFAYLSLSLSSLSLSLPLSHTHTLSVFHPSYITVLTEIYAKCDSI